MITKKKPFCSIIVLTYMTFTNIENNLESIAHQSFDNYEVIIQDDGSECFDYKYISECVKNAGLEDVTHIFHNAKNVGTVKNYNIAIDNASGEIIIPLSQDDIFFDENVVFDICNIFSESEIKACYGKRMNQAGKILPIKSSFDMLYSSDISKVYFRLLYRNFIYGASLYFRKEVWKQMGKFDEERYRLLEDYPFCLKLLKKRISIMPIERVCIRYGSKGISANNSPKNRISKVLNDDNIALYNNFSMKEIDELRTIVAKRTFHYRWLSAYFCNEQPEKVKQRRMLIIAKYPLIAIIHKLLYLIYGDNSDDIMVNILYDIEMRKRKNASD